MKRRLLPTALLCAACTSSATPDLSLDIRLPVDRTALASVTSVNMTATRSGVVLAQRSFAASTGTVSLSGISHGADTVVTLFGLSASSSVIASGRTCPLDFEANGGSAPLYFAPTNYFLPTLGAPLTARQQPTAVALDDGSVLVAGGADASGAPLASTERFTPGLGSFTAGSVDLLHARWRARAVGLSGVGVLVLGGLDGSGATLGDAELYSAAGQQFVALSDSKMDGRVGHSVVVLPDGRAFVSGGSSVDGGDPLATTYAVYVLSDGSFQVTAGPPLTSARREHATVVASGIPVVFGGYGAGGVVLDSIEELVPDATTNSVPAASLTYARAEATATQLTTGATAGSILVVGGVGSDGTPRQDAEVFNPISRTTTIYTLAVARRGHTATLLGDGRVLVAGGFGKDGAALTSVELFRPDGAGFVTGRTLGTARGDHAAVSLCDETVLLVGGATTAELYSGPGS